MRAQSTAGGEVAMVVCEDDSECAEEFRLDGVTYELGCDAVLDSAIADELGRGQAFFQELVVYRLTGFDPQVAVGVNIPGGDCSDNDPQRVSTAWSFAFAAQADGAAIAEAVCELGALSPARAEVNQCAS